MTRELLGELIEHLRSLNAQMAETDPTDPTFATLRMGIVQLEMRIHALRKRLEKAGL